MRASDMLADSRVQKPKNFLAFFSRLLPPPTAKRKKKWKGNFLVLLRRLHIYIVFYHTIVSRHNIGYTHHNNYVRFIKKTSFEYEKD